MNAVLNCPEGILAEQIFCVGLVPSRAKSTVGTLFVQLTKARSGWYSCAALSANDIERDIITHVVGVAGSEFFFDSANPALD